MTRRKTLLVLTGLLISIGRIAWGTDAQQKNSPDSGLSSETVGAFEAWAPGPSSKNFDSTPLWYSQGETTRSVPGPSSKNFAVRSDEPSSPSPDAALQPRASVDFSCSASGNMNWITNSSSFEIVRQCTLTVPSEGFLFISANGSVFNTTGEYEGQFRIDVDNTAGDANIDRWVNVYNDSGDGSDLSVAISVLKEVTAGTHTVYLLGRRYSGSGEVGVYDPTLSAIFAPLTQVCGSSGNLTWTTTSSQFEILRQCTIEVPTSGRLLLSADGSLFNSSGEYEGQFRIDIDSTAGDANIDRWVNVYNDSGDGSDESVALTVAKSVSAGTHTVYFLGKRYSGAGEVGVYDPTLSAIFVPDLGSCGISGNASWYTTSTSNEVIRQCTIEVPKAGPIFISADGSLFNSNGEYEAQFEIDIDGIAGDPSIDRWVNVYNDSGDGTDRSVSLSVIKEVTAGTHTVYFLGKRFSGAAEVGMYDATLSAWGASLVIFSSGFESQSTSDWAMQTPPP